MKYYKLGEWLFYAHQENTSMRISLLEFSFGIEYKTEDMAPYFLNIEGVEECTEYEFDQAEKQVRKMMFDARQLFTPKAIAA